MYLHLEFRGTSLLRSGNKKIIKNNNNKKFFLIFHFSEFFILVVICPVNAAIRDQKFTLLR